MEKRLLSWLVLSTLLFVTLLYVRNRLFPPPVKTAPAVVREEADVTGARTQMAGRSVLTWLATTIPAYGWQIPTDLAMPQVLEAQVPLFQAFVDNQAILAVAEENIILNPPGSQIQVELSKRGAAVRSITLHRFEEADRKTARPADRPLMLVSDTEDGKIGMATATERLKRQSYRLLVDGHPLVWQVRSTTPEQVVFEATIARKNIRILKTFTLKPDQYHVDLDVRLEPIDPLQKCEPLAYELTGPQGVPVEGEYWKSTPFRQVVIGSVDAASPGNLRRKLYDPAAIDPSRDNKAPPINYADPGLQQEFQYAGVMNQFFAALAVVNIGKDEPPKPRAIAQAVPQYLGDEPVDRWSNKRLAGKITVNLVSRPVKLDKGAAQTDHFLLYAGPVKVILLDYEKDVRRGLPDHYAYQLHLSTLTDYPSDNWLASFFYAIGWTRLLIFCTNLMHVLIEWLHYFVPVYGLNIILITFIVRMAMFPVSRKQAITMQKTQKLAPELAKLKEKYKDDVQQLMQAQRELYRKHGVNPASGCLIVLLQMPVFMGLYYALNESVHLRLSSFLWAENLAAPDMLVRWENWPVISSVAAFLHLGPYFHLLPIISIVLIIVQQKLTMPPAVDEQQKMQMKMMNIMMYFMAYMFYWVAAGLCLYFTVSGIWGMVERRFLPKKNTAAEPAGTATGRIAPVSPNRASPTPASTRRAREQRESQNGESDGLLNRVAAWWKKLLEQAEKK